VLVDNLVRVQCLPTREARKVVFLRATDPSTGRWGRTPVSGSFCLADRLLSVTQVTCRLLHRPLLPREVFIPSPSSHWCWIGSDAR
jgi:hypothetical protein